MAHPIVYGPAGSTYVWSARLALAEKGVTHELVDVPFGAHREDVLETESREFCVKKLMFRVVNFIDGDEDRFSGLTQFFSQHFVDRRHAGGAVSDENDRVRHLHGEFSFGLHLIVKRIAQG